MENDSVADIDTKLKVIQIAFYVVGATVAVLTYLSAKRGLLNTVNTEYQKRVMDRLKELAEELGSEFYMDSPNYWASQDSVKQVVDQLHERFKANRDKILETREFSSGIPVSSDYRRLYILVEKVKSDPFIPKKVRDIVVDLLETRASVLLEAHMAILEQYTHDLANGKYLHSLDTNCHWLHNKIFDYCRDRGCAIGQIQEETHKVRLAIQEYMESFNPLRSL
jgi:hypothetical protein